MDSSLKYRPFPIGHNLIGWLGLYMYLLHNIHVYHSELVRERQRSDLDNIAVES